VRNGKVRFRITVHRASSIALASLIREDDTINYGVVQPGDDHDEGIPLVRVGDLIEGKVRHSELKRIAPAIEAAYKRSRLRGDEILVSCVGSIG
jgi:type I restriction enzyme S subunit